MSLSTNKLCACHHFSNFTNAEFEGGSMRAYPTLAIHCTEEAFSLMNEMLRLVGNRGPNAIQTIEISQHITLSCSVLHIQGSTMINQPFITDNGNLLCWNGEVFDGIDIDEAGDTVALANLLESSQLPENFQTHVLDSLCKVCGPYAFVYYVKAFGKIIFGRDPFGRRSLLGLWSNETLIAVSSTGCALPQNTDFEWREFDISGLFSYSIADGSMKNCSWPVHRLRVCRDSFSSIEHHLKKESSHLQFLDILKRAVQRRVSVLTASSSSDVQSPVGVLFSGGIDSVLLAAVLHSCLESSVHIDLINVTFMGGSASDGGDSVPGGPSPDRVAGVAALCELQLLFPTRKWRLVHVDVPPDERMTHEEHIRALIQPSNTHMDLNIGTAFWFAARAVGYVQEYAADCLAAAYDTTENGRHLLRSGDDEVAKSLGRKNSLSYSKTKKMDPYQNTEQFIVDRNFSTAECNRIAKWGCHINSCKRCCYGLYKQALKSLTPLDCQVCPVHHKIKRNDAPVMASQDSQGDIQEVTEQREDKCTEQANETAAVNTGTVVHDEFSVKSPYTSQCRALLIGIGADEQMAGYGRHRTTFQRGGWSALHEELQMDMTRLWQRNLGRDDRCVSDNGREAWFPYLDEELVAFLHSLPLDEIADLALEQGHGDKKILRDAARHLGLCSSSKLVKRAIQFGTRVAKLTNVMYHGSHRKGKGSTVL